MSQPNVYVDIDSPASLPIQVHLGQTLVLIRQSMVGGRWLRQLDLPASHFAVQPIVNHGMTPLPGQPEETHIVASGTAQQAGSGDIFVQFAPPNPMCEADDPISVAFTVS